MTSDRAGGESCAPSVRTDGSDGVPAVAVKETQSRWDTPTRVAVRQGVGALQQMGGRAGG